MTSLHPLSVRKDCQIIELRKEMYELAENGAWSSLLSQKGIYSARHFCSHSQCDVYMYTCVGVYAMCHFGFQGVYVQRHMLNVHVS